MIEADWGSYAAGSGPRVSPVAWLLGPLYAHGLLAVVYFWMISGFVFAFVYGGSKIGLAEYAGRRLARLYPLHFATLLIVTLCQVALIALVGTHLFYPEHDLYHFMLNLFFIPAWGLENGQSFNGPIWSVSVEVPVYILFWLCIRKLPMNAGMTLALACVCFLLQRVVTFSQVDFCAMMFFLGATVFYMSRGLEPMAQVLLAGAGWIAGTGAVLLVPELREVNTLLLIVGFGPPLTILAGLDRLWSGRGGVLETLGKFGDLSYSIYLLHLPIILAVTTGMVALEIDRSVLSGNLFAMLLYLAVTIGLSRLSFVWFENPARRWLRRVFAPAAVPGVATTRIN